MTRDEKIKQLAAAFGVEATEQRVTELAKEVLSHVSAASAALNTFGAHLTWLFGRAPPIADEYIRYVEEMCKAARAARATEN